MHVLHDGINSKRENAMSRRTQLSILCTLFHTQHCQLITEAGGHYTRPVMVYTSYSIMRFFSLGLEV
jgi:hypothetical protein